jgi:NitT/TauT family transport system substrate-binding protein
MRLSRLLWLALSVLLLVSCQKPAPVKAEAPPHLTLLLNYYPQADFGGYYAALIHGYWKELGLDVSIVSGGPNAMMEKRLSVEPDTVGLCTADNIILARDRGLPLIAVQTMLQHIPMAFMVHEKSPVQSLADLEGKTISVDPNAPFMLYLMHKYGLKKVHTFGETGGIAVFLHNKDLVQQVHLINEPYYVQKEGVPFRTFSVAESGWDPSEVIGTHEDYVKQHPDRIRAFAQGALRGWKSYYADPAPVLAYLKTQNPNLKDEGMAFALKEMHRLHCVEGFAEKGERLGLIQDSRWEQMQAAMLDCRMIAQPVDLTKAYTKEFNPEKLGIDPTLP